MSEARAVPAPSEPHVVEMPPLSMRAAVSSVDDAERTVELIFSTGAAVERYDWMRDERFLEVLSLDPSHVDIARLNDGGPLLDAHSAYSVRSQIGAVVPGTVKLTKKAATATVRFSKRAEVEPIWQDVRDGIIRSVSVGYRVHEFVESRPKGNALPVRTAVRWTPYEVSMVPIPADAGARVRSGQIETNSCQVVPAGHTPPVPAPEPAAGPAPTPQSPVAGAATIQKERAMEDPNAPAQTIRADMSLTPPEPPAAPPEPTERDRGAEAERSRVAGIRRACLNARVGRAFEDELIENGVALEEAQRRVLEEVGKRDVDVPARTSRPDIRVGDDPFVHVRAGIEEALLFKAHPYVPARGNEAERGFKLTDRAKPYVGLNLMRTAERYLVQRGIRTESMSEIEMAGLALGLSQRASGMHSPSDFADLLADVAGKTLRAAYMESPQTFGPITRMVTARDFKPIKRNQIGEAPTLQEVTEHGEIPFGTIGEAKEQYQLATYARRFAITRQALINDDLDAFSRLPLMFGRQARNKESDLVWAQITTVPNLMGDGTTLFDAAHGNVDATGAAISVAAISAGRTAMRVQTGVDGETLLNIVPRYILVPASLETEADQFVSQALVAAQASNVNPFAGRLSVIAEPRLDANSELAWYLAASVADGQDVLELAMLEGQQGPLVEQQIGFGVDGIEMKVRHDIAAKVIDWRGLYKNVGAS